MSFKPTVSVIIPNYNYGRFLSEAIESVLSQTYACSEIIVVDDGSTDDSLNVLAQYEKKGVKVIRQKNCGVGAARNAGAKASSGDFIAFFDADDIWLPHKIERQLELFQSDKEIGLTTVGVREFGKDGKTIAKYLNGQNGWCAEDLLIFRPVVIVPGTTAMIKREVFELVGGFDETKEMHPSEDWEFCYRVARNFKLAYLPEVLVEYRNHGDNGHLKIPRFERAMLLVYEKTFRDCSPEIQELKRQAYGNLHTILAGSYFQTRNYRQFIKHSLKSFWLTPQNIAYFAKFPFRKLKRNNSFAE